MSAVFSMEKMHLLMYKKEAAEDPDKSAEPTTGGSIEEPQAKKPVPSNGSNVPATVQQSQMHPWGQWAMMNGMGDGVDASKSDAYRMQVCASSFWGRKSAKKLT